MLKPTTPSTTAVQKRKVPYLFVQGRYKNTSQPPRRHFLPSTITPARSQSPQARYRTGKFRPHLRSRRAPRFQSADARVRPGWLNRADHRPEPREDWAATPAAAAQSPNVSARARPAAGVGDGLGVGSSEGAGGSAAVCEGGCGWVWERGDV